MNRPVPASQWLLPTAIAVLTAICVFILPFAFPPSHPAYGQSYVVGFNNRVAIVLIAAISLCVLGLGLWRGVPSASDSKADPDRLPIRYLVAMATLTTVWIGWIGWLLLQASAHANEDGYFIPQMEKVLLNHRQLYSQVEFVYGPLLFYPTAWMARIAHASPVSITASYYITLVLHHVIGLGMLCFVLNRLPLRRIMRLGMFFSISLFSLNPWMGLNYTLLRFLSPIFFLVILDQLDSPLLGFAWAFVTGGIALYISPELGIAYSFGVIAYSISRGSRQNRGFFAESGGVLAGIASAVIFAPASMLSGLTHYSGGFHHVVLLPSLYIFFGLAAIVWFSPRLIAGCVLSNARYASLLVGIYIVSMTMIPAIFGSEESMHVMSNGIGFFLLTAVYLSNDRVMGRAWIAATAATYAFFLLQTFAMSRTQLTIATLCGDSTGRIARSATNQSPQLQAKIVKLQTLDCTRPVELADWSGWIQSQPFAVLHPSYSYNIDSLIASPQYRPLYFDGEADMYDSQADQLLVNELRQVQWAFIGRDIGPHPIGPDSDNALDLHIHFRKRHSIARNVLVADEIRNHWVAVAQVDPTLSLYKRID